MKKLLSLVASALVFATFAAALADEAKPKSKAYKYKSPIVSEPGDPVPPPPAPPEPPTETEKNAKSPGDTKSPAKKPK